MEPMGESEHRTFVDPALPWDGDFPYEVLRRFGVTPDSPADAVQDASFEMTPEDLADANVNLAWEQLRVPRRRLLIDFFCYQLPPEAPAADQTAAAAYYPLPWAFVRKLAQTPPPSREPAEGGHHAAWCPQPLPPAVMPPALGGSLPLWEGGTGLQPVECTDTGKMPVSPTQESEEPDER